MDSDRPPCDPEELLAQLGWVKALARERSSSTPDMADDLLQRVCLLALQRAPRQAREGAGLARLAGLGDAQPRPPLGAQRAAGGCAASRPPRRPRRCPSTFDLAERRETLRLLVEAVTGLEEPYFSSIVERYFEGLGRADIAARHGLATGDGAAAAVAREAADPRAARACHDRTTEAPGSPRCS